MSRIKVNVRLRPVRMGFLVRPENKEALRRTFQVNTCLWGGRFNPIIPIFQELPDWWDRNEFQTLNGPQVLNGCLDFFEPDILVETEAGLADGLGYDPDRVISIDKVLYKSGDRHGNGVGLSAIYLYRKLYKDELKFTRRFKHQILSVIEDDCDKSLLSSCLFGGFPDIEGFEYFSEQFNSAADPNFLTTRTADIRSLYKLDFNSPLDFTKLDLRESFHVFDKAALYIFDGKHSGDLIDLWNLRSIIRDVMAVPIQWLESVADLCRVFIDKNFKPIGGHPQGFKYATPLFWGRSLSEEVVQGMQQHLAIEDSDAILPSQYPQFWEKRFIRAMGHSRVTLSAEEKTFDTPVDLESLEIRFNKLSPQFPGVPDQWSNEMYWVNVVTFNDWTFRDQIATVFPTNYRHPRFPILDTTLRGTDLLPTTEGLVTFPQWRDQSQRWELLRGTDAISRWLKINGVEAKQSDGGRSAAQIIDTLQGLKGVSNIANAGIIKLLEATSRRPIARSVRYQKFQNLIRNAVDPNPIGENHADNLIELGAVALGMELKCTKCSSVGWYPLKDLAYELTCDLCQKLFKFPITNPSVEGHWAYRVVGPFALPNYAAGGYATALTIRFFSRVMNSFNRDGLTWSSGMDLTFPGDPPKIVECDFILWNQKKNAGRENDHVSIVFGEAKSFGSREREEDDPLEQAVEGEQKPPRVSEVFKEKDVAQLRHVAEQFPGSIFVFSTMKSGDQFTDAEKARLTEFALWGRELTEDRQRARAPVIILTDIELFAGQSLMSAWGKKGGQHAQFSTNRYYRSDDLEHLANMTQQLYLGLPSYLAWRD